MVVFVNLTALVLLFNQDWPVINTPQVRRAALLTIAAGIALNQLVRTTLAPMQNALELQLMPIQVEALRTTFSAKEEKTKAV